MACAQNRNDSASVNADTLGAASRRAADTTTGMTGAASEEEFKALHQLTKEQAPPARGVDVEIAGSRAYLSVPRNAQPPYPGLIVIHEWYGLNDHLRHWADRLADDGYAALAVDLYAGRVADNPDSAMAYMKSVNEERSWEILQGAYRFLAEDPRIAATRRGTIGWCFGGGWSLQCALTFPDLDACVIYYGRLVTTPPAYEKVKAPILGVFGNQDGSINPEMVNQFEKALQQANVRYEIHRYDAGHAFANPSAANYNEAAASDAWQKTRAFLAKYLKQG
jgi:carboxymethylenebutenolidase